MSQKHNGINYSRLSPVKARRIRVVTRLENQLIVGSKTTKEGKVALTEKDTKRINKEIEILKSRA